ncbi:hypothetical protein Tco_0368924 [Tanacetum coccineum]
MHSHSADIGDSWGLKGDSLLWIVRGTRSLRHFIDYCDEVLQIVVIDCGHIVFSVNCDSTSSTNPDEDIVAGGTF